MSMLSVLHLITWEPCCQVATRSVEEEGLEAGEMIKFVQFSAARCVPALRLRWLGQASPAAAGLHSWECVGVGVMPGHL